MDLHDVHRAQVIRFTQWFGQKRTGKLSDLASEFEMFKSDWVNEDTMLNSAEVTSLLENYHAQVLSRVREQLEATVNLSAVFVAQLLSQAETSGLALQVEDISSIEDQNKLGQVGSVAALTAPPLAPPRRVSLEAMTVGGPSSTDNVGLLQRIDELEAEKAQMHDRSMRVERELTNLSKERSVLAAEVQQVRDAMANGATHSDAQSAALAVQTNSLSHMLEAKTQECDAAKMELSQHLSQSAQFTQLKALLKQRTQEVKGLRQTLVNAGLLQPEAFGGGIELQADSD